MKMEQAKAKAEILKAMANPVRIVVTEALSRGDLCVSDLNKLVGVRQPTLSRHLNQLKKAGIVTERRVGAKVLHHLACPCMLRAVDCTLEALKSVTDRRSRLLRPRG